MFYLVDKLAGLPVGTIVSWVMKVDNNGGEIVDLPSGWVRCDGETIPHNEDGESIWAGKRVPDLNGERRFLRGGDDVSVLTMEDDQLQSHEHTLNDPGHSHTYTDTYFDYSADGYLSPHDTDHHSDRYDYPHTGRITSSISTGITVTGVKDEEYEHHLDYSCLVKYDFTAN